MKPHSKRLGVTFSSVNLVLPQSSKLDQVGNPYPPSVGVSEPLLPHSLPGNTLSLSLDLGRPKDLPTRLVDLEQ